MTLPAVAWDIDVSIGIEHWLIECSRLWALMNDAQCFRFLRHTAMSNACNTASVVCQFCSGQPTTRRAWKFIATAE